MTRPKATIADQLSNAQLALSNSQTDAEIKTLVSAYGYNNEELLAGHQLLVAAQNAVVAHDRAFGEQRVATEAFNAAQTQAFDAYQALAKVARASIDPANLDKLGLNGTMPRTPQAFQKAARSLFANAAALPALAKRGYDPARLQAENAKIAAFETADNCQEVAKGAAQQATRDQDAALDALNKWTAEYLKIAKVALRAKPELLEKLGVLARSSPTAAQQTARKKTPAPPAS